MKKILILLVLAVLILSVAVSADSARKVMKKYDRYGASVTSSIESYTGIDRQDRITMLMRDRSGPRQETSETVNDRSANSIYLVGREVPSAPERRTYGMDRESLRYKSYGDTKYQGGTSSRIRYVRTDDRFYDLRVGANDLTEKQVVKTFHAN